MEIKGKIYYVGQVETGKSEKTGNEWQRQNFVVEVQSGMYYKKISLSIMGQNLQRFGHLIVAGKSVNVSFDINAKEYNGRWYNELTVWLISEDNSEANKAATTVHKADGTVEAAEQNNSSTFPPATDENGKPIEDNTPF